MSDDYRSILRLVNSRLPLPLLYAGCNRALANRMPAANMYISIVETEGLRFPYYIDSVHQENTLKIYPKEGWTGYVIDTKRRYWLSKDAHPPKEVRPVGTLPEDWLGVPILGRDAEPLGVLTVQTYQPGFHYKESDLEFVEFTANALALALQLASQNRELAIRRIAALVDETVEFDDLYPKIHEIMQNIIPAARRNIIIARVDEEAGVFRPVYWKDEQDDYDSKHWPLNVGLSGYMYKVSRTSYIYEDGKSTLPPEAITTGGPPRYWLGTPLYGGDRIIGVVVIQSYDSNDVITKEDEYALNGICPYIATAISQTEVFSKLRRS